ncbi:MAG: MFS transporter [Gammaproteobacteria bacterium]|nr:MFS transporter [Gammaproteobacteria bacterium]
MTNSIKTYSTSTKNKFIAIASLIIAGEIIFALPFHLARFFRPTMLEVFELSATQLGTAQGIYGIAAMLSYFPGGFLADRFPTHKLLAISLWMTAAGGLYLASSPNYIESLFIFAFFGVTTIMLFWGALIRATREWGGLQQQGMAFGLLEGGRGLLAVSLASLGVLLFEISFPTGYTTATLAQKQSTFSIVIYAYTLVTFFTGVLVWFSLKNHPNPLSNNFANNIGAHFFSNIKKVIFIPAVWLQALIVLCSYVGYKGLDNLSLYAVDAYQYDALQAAKLVTIAAWIRPVAAIMAGIIADHTHPIKMLILSFAMLLLANLYFSLSTPTLHFAWILFANVIITCIAVFALRVLYFAIFEHYQLPRTHTGSAVGLISIIGFLPDVFVLYTAGKLVDTYPGIEGHQFFYMFLAIFSLVGLLASVKLKLQSLTL